MDKPVRTRGRLEMLPQASGGLAYALRGMFGGRLYVSPMAHIADEWEDEARAWVGREVEVSGLVGMGSPLHDRRRSGVHLDLELPRAAGRETDRDATRRSRRRSRTW